jgi:hypothetical protein
VTISGTFGCFADGQFCPLIDVKSAKNGSNWDAYFSVCPLANYSVTVTLRETLENPAILVTQVKKLRILCRDEYTEKAQLIRNR